MSANYIFLTAGGFDTDRVRGWLEARPDAFEDPMHGGWFYLCGAPSYAAFLEDKRRKEPERGALACLVVVAREQVILNQEYGDAAALRSGLDFATWLTSQFPCSVRIDGYADITERVAAEGVASLYPERVRALPLSWSGQLIGIGFYGELPHGAPQGPSLALARQAQGIPEEAQLVKYLESGQLYRRAVPLSETHPWLEPPAGDSTYDWFDTDIDIGPPHQLTDGVYIWPADLAYYVRTYHVRLPRAFVIHARNNDYQVPAVDVASLPAFEP